jgi:hypothetical protein
MQLTLAYQRVQRLIFLILDTPIKLNGVTPLTVNKRLLKILEHLLGGVGTTVKLKHKHLLTLVIHYLVDFLSKAHIGEGLKIQLGLEAQSTVFLLNKLDIFNKVASRCLSVMEN